MRFFLTTYYCVTVKIFIWCFTLFRPATARSLEELEIGLEMCARVATLFATATPAILYLKVNNFSTINLYTFLHFHTICFKISLSRYSTWNFIIFLISYYIFCWKLNLPFYNFVLVLSVICLSYLVNLCFLSTLIFYSNWPAWRKISLVFFNVFGLMNPSKAAIILTLLRLAAGAGVTAAAAAVR